MEEKSLLTRIGEAWDQHRQARKEREITRVGEPSQQRFRYSFHWLLPTPGNVLFTFLVIGSLLWAQNVGAISLGAPSAVTTSITGIPYQGRLADKNGAPLTQTVNMTFRLYVAASGGSFLWEEPWTGANSVQVSDGLFNVMLGSLTQIPQAVITGNNNLFLGITVGTDSEISPRVQLGSVPFATQALTVPDGSIVETKLANGSVTKNKIVEDSIKSEHLNLNSGSSCLANHAEFDVALNQAVTVPGLNLSFTLNKPAKVLLWMDGMAHTEPQDSQDVRYSLLINGATEGLSMDTHSVYWHNLTTQRLVNLPAGNHTVGMVVSATKQTSFWIYGAGSNKTCIYYLVLGS